MKPSPLYPELFLGVDGEVYAHGVKHLPQYLSKAGYLVVSYKSRPVLVHRIIASIYCTGFTPGLAVDHIDGNKLNNEPANLEWVTLSENNRRARVNGLNNNAGEKHGLARLTDSDVINIRDRYARGERQRTIAEDLGVCLGSIRRIVTGRSWRHLPLTRQPPRPGWMTPELLSSALAMLGAGMTIADAARELEIKYATLRAAVRAHDRKIKQ